MNATFTKIKTFGIKYFNYGWIGMLLSGSLFIAIASFATDRDAPRVYAVDAAEINRGLTVQELATWYIENKKDFEILDLRTKDQYEEGHIRQAMSCPVCHLNKADAQEKMKAGQEMPNFQKKIVVYTASGSEVMQLPSILATNKNLYRLVGGYEAWQDEILEVKTFKPEDSVEVINEKKRANAMSNFFTGKTVVAAPVTKFKKIKKRKHVISSGANEGC